MFGLATAASAACALACATELDVNSAQPDLLAATPNLHVSASTYAANPARSPVGDLMGRGWNSSTAQLGRNSELRVSVYRRGDSAMGGASDSLALSDPALASRYGDSVRLDLSTRVFESEAGQLDFDFGPRAGFSAGPGGRTAGAGVVARLGQDVNNRDKDKPTWYLFAGADAKAVVLDPRESYMGLTDLHTQRKEIVGDAQAGIAFNLGEGRMGEGELAIAYVRRERSHAANSWGLDRTDGFAAVSFSWRPWSH